MKKRKTALITGVTGQDGSYLAEFLLEKDYEVHSIKRRSSSFNTARIDHIFEKIQADHKSFHIHYADLSDSMSITKIISIVRPDEVYNLGAQSHVGVSFQIPEYTSDINGLGALRILEAIRMLNLTDHTRYYQASTSELYGDALETPQNENTPFNPQSPYAVSKLYAYWITKNYRQAYGIYAYNGILFNHESPRRGETFVTRKITQGLANVALGLEECLYMGNIDALRDWGDAREFVEMQWLMLQQDEPDDYVIATGEQHSIREFIEWTAFELGIKIEFKGSGLKEIAVATSIANNSPATIDEGCVVMRIDPRYYRPAEVPSLLGDPSKARKKLGWKTKKTARELCADMLRNDLVIAKQSLVLKEHNMRFTNG